MTSIDLLANWPGWDKKSADELMSSPAWSMMVRYGDEEMRMRLSSTAPRDVIGLRISFDDEEHFLGLGKRESFPDLSALWYEKKRLPEPLILALIEKECGELLQLLENAVRAQLKVIGLAPAEDRADAQGFEVVDKSGEIIAFFSLSLSHMVKTSFGDVANIDTSHPSIRELEMPSKIQYVSFQLNDEDAKGIASGDTLLLPEVENLVVAKWMPNGIEHDGKYHVLAEEDGVLTFADLADETLPPIPEPDRLVLVKDGRNLAVGRLVQFGLTNAFAIEEVF